MSKTSDTSSDSFNVCQFWLWCGYPIMQRCSQIASVFTLEEIIFQLRLGNRFFVMLISRLESTSEFNFLKTKS